MTDPHKMTPEDYAIYGRNVARWFDVAGHPRWPGPIWNFAHVKDAATMATRTAMRAAIAVADTELTAQGLFALNGEQVACLLDGSRTEEALAMVDDLESRCGLSGYARGELAGLIADVERCGRGV